MDRVAGLIQLLRERGSLTYDGEGVSQLQHAWQCGRLARLAGAGVGLQLAAWLHDIGHLMTDLPGSPTLAGRDDAHEALGARQLEAAFGPAVAGPVALHVAAKRYLVATRPDYLGSLSADSLRSLRLQGGPMSAAECASFIALPHARDALRLRVWDDLAKDPAGGPGEGVLAFQDLDRLLLQLIPA
jgi:phosphonate degradation associated HDIG domain protein